MSDPVIEPKQDPKPKQGGPFDWGLLKSFQSHVANQVWKSYIKPNERVFFFLHDYPQIA